MTLAIIVHGGAKTITEDKPDYWSKVPVRELELLLLGWVRVTLEKSKVLKSIGLRVGDRTLW